MKKVYQLEIHKYQTSFFFLFFPLYPFGIIMFNIYCQIYFWESPVEITICFHIFLPCINFDIQHMIAWYINSASIKQIQISHDFAPTDRPHCHRWETGFSHYQKLKQSTSWCFTDFQLSFLSLTVYPFSARHMASCIFSFSTSPNRVHKTTVKQMVISLRDCLTFEK